MLALRQTLDHARRAPRVPVLCWQDAHETSTRSRRTRHGNLQVIDPERDGDDCAEVSCTACLFAHLYRIYWRQQRPPDLSTRERILAQEGKAARAAAHAVGEAADAVARALAPRVAQELARAATLERA